MRGEAGEAGQGGARRRDVRAPGTAVDEDEERTSTGRWSGRRGRMMVVEAVRVVWPIREL